MSKLLTRRSALIGMGAGAASALAGCDVVGQNPSARKILFSGDGMHYRLQRALVAPNALAVEYRADQMSPKFKQNGSTNPQTPEYVRHVKENFANWRLVVDGLVTKPLSLSLPDVRSMPARTQITRHDCVEGWSAIGQWTGPRLGPILKLAGLRDDAKYIVFHCADILSGKPYYESIDLVDAFHPQTLLAWGMNGETLSVGHGAPIRLRVERQLGYKHAKYVMRVEAVASLDGIYGGNGGLWEDIAGYEWYAGI